jgi:hypothetical protein
VTRPRVFVSCAAQLEPADQAAADRWAAALRGMDLVPVTLTREAYRVPPWEQLRALVRSCQGLVALGFARSPTPWNHVEAGLAIMAGLPVLVAAEEGRSDAVFGPEVWGEGVRGVRLRVWEEPEPLADPALRAWIADISRS